MGLIREEFRRLGHVWYVYNEWKAEVRRLSAELRTAKADTVFTEDAYYLHRNLRHAKQKLLNAYWFLSKLDPSSAQHEDAHTWD